MDVSKRNYSLKIYDDDNIIRYHIQFFEFKLIIEMGSIEDENVNELLENARREIAKLRPQLTDEQVDKIKQTESRNILEHSVSFADNVLKRLVAHTIDEDVDDLFNECVETRGSILINEEGDGKDKEPKKYTLELDIVDRDYMVDLKHFKGDKNVKDRIVFLLNTVKVLYCPIKDHMKKWAVMNDTTFNYVLQIGLNTTLFLDKDSKKRIGVKLTVVNE